MDPKCTGVSINEIHTTSDATDDLSQKSPAASQSHEHHQQNLDVEQASMLAGDLQSTTPPRLTVLDEIQVLKEQIRHLQIQTKAAPLNSQEAQLQAVSEQNETIQRMKECLRNHSHEWDFRDGLESYSTTDAIERALHRSANREQDKNMAGAYFLIGEAKMADSFLHRFYDSDNDDDDDNYEERQLREQLMVKRREFLKSMELKIETITEGLMRIRLTKKLRKQQKAAELERVAEMRAAEMKAAEMREAEMRAAEVLEQGARNEPSSLPDIEQEDFPILKPEAYQYALAKVNPIDWSSFKTLGSMTESDSCVIDVLIGEPLVTEEVSAGHLSWAHDRNSRTRTAPQPQKPNPVVLSGPRGQALLPERIRIHSKLLLKILAQLVGPDGNEMNLQAPSIVFLRPFKVIALYENKLRDWLKRLEEGINSPPLLYGPATEEGVIKPTVDASELGK
ncbi:hypothetical protein TGAMA5MH_08348 [Trichoderma gamsii]|uniref:Uncharacterized protein n=1 Tax=Trichoderma gamsii TaxID=398673 RepID=A0A2K0T2B9_9HYPO|nr:hypothetical protein TGAMA5MH_08348 [Trichoderma gamsii]